MSLFPGRRMLVACAAWMGGALAAVLFPILLPPLLAAAAGVLAAAFWDARRLGRQPAPEFQRAVPERATQDRDAELRLLVTNRGRERIEIDVVEELPRDLAASDPRFAGVRIEPGRTLELRYTVRPALRGDRPLGRITLLQRSPLGLWRRRVLAGEGAQLRVFPDARRFLRREALDPRRIRALLGTRPSPRRGEGMDFESLREYVVGDDPRRIDWAATARRGRLITRLYQHERNHTIVIAVDTSRLMAARCGARTKLDHAVDAALALGLAALSHGDRVELLLFDRELRGHVAPRAHRGEIGPLVELLRNARSRAVEADYAKLARGIAARGRPRALVVVLTDFVEATSAGIEAPLRALQRRHRTLLVALRDPLFEALEPGGGEPRERNLYRRLVLDDLLRDRETALARLRRGAVQTVDLPPDRIVAPLLNRYLQFRYGPDR